ncbi:MAG: glycine-rich protein [Firmicutes bacterium]|nr:glycine-rich protein [Bacillota bacterium]
MANQIFYYTGGVQSIELLPGTHTIRAWGGSGEFRVDTQGTATSAGTGGYVRVNYSVHTPTTVYVVVGGSGQRGGYNGGGNVPGSILVGPKRGGGATHLSLASGLLSNSSVRSNIILAAGGGGGCGGGIANYGGGDGGGLIGGVTSSNNPRHGKGGTQSEGGAAGVSSSMLTPRATAGSAGQGGNGGNGSYEGGGGGGGWFGGGGGDGGRLIPAEAGGGGGGGSSHLSNRVSGITSMFGAPNYVRNPLMPTIGGISTNGLVIIGNLNFPRPNAPTDLEVTELWYAEHEKGPAPFTLRWKPDNSPTLMSQQIFYKEDMTAHKEDMIAHVSRATSSIALNSPSGLYTVKSVGVDGVIGGVASINIIVPAFDYSVESLKFNGQEVKEVRYYGPTIRAGVIAENALVNKIKRIRTQE